MPERSMVRQKMTGKIRNEKYDGLILYFVTFMISVIPALFYTAPAFEDGLGTMATAAYLAGHDWSDFLVEDGYYYKYGQAFWYIIPFMLIHNVVLRYRIMLLINTVLTSFIPVIAYQIAMKHKLADKADAFAISLLTGLMPCILLYNKYTWAETNLFLIPWLILFLETKLYEEKSLEAWKKKMYSTGIAFLAIYAFMSHQRGLILVIATTIMILLISYSRKGSVSVPAYISALVLGLLADHYMSAWQKEHVYAGAVLMHNTLADFLKPEIYQKLFSLKGMEAMIKSFLGWLYNCSCSTFSIALAGLCFMIAALLGCIWKRRLESIKEILAGQGLLCFLGAFALGLLFFFQSSYGYFDGTQMERSDHLLFGRYLESSLPVLFYFGLIGINRMQPGRKIFNLPLIIHAGLFVFAAIELLPIMRNVDCYVHSLMSMNLFMDAAEVTMTWDIIPNYVPALFLFGVLSVFVALLFRAIFQRNRCIAYILIGVLFLWIYIWNSITVIGCVDSAHATKYAVLYLDH